MTQAQTSEIPVLSEMLDEHADEWEVTGGGKGWTVTMTVDGDEHIVKATSKAQALTDALGLIQSLEDEPADEDEAEADEEIEGCAEECQSSESAFCQCACQGANHGILVSDRKPVVLIGSKTCKCGCGEMTKRTFVPGHDARYHGEQALIKWAQEQGLEGSMEDLRKAKKAAVRKAARIRRAATRAAVAVKAEAVAASVPAGRKPGRSSKPGTTSVAAAIAGDLPF